MAATYQRTITTSLLTSGLAGNGLGYRVVSSADESNLIARTTAGITEAGATANYSAVPTWNRSWIGKILWEDANGNLLAQEDFQDSIDTDGLVSNILRDANPANQDVPGSTGYGNKLAQQLIILCTVSDETPAPSSFMVELASGVFPGQLGPFDNFIKFTSGALTGYGRQVTGFIPSTESTSRGRITFATPFNVAPADGDEALFF